MNDVDHDSQEQELEVLEAIFPGCVTAKGSNTFNLSIPVELDGEKDVFVGTDSTRIAHLPPVLIDLILPPTYPSLRSPEISLLRTAYNWLPERELRALQSHLLAMWNAGEVLYNWVECVRTGEFLDVLELSDDKSIRLPVELASSSLLQLLHTNHRNITQDLFDRSSFSCSICLSPQKGSRSVRLACTHVFCKECLSDFWGLCITEGDVSRVGCAAPECIKSARTASLEEVEMVFSANSAEVARWKWLVKKTNSEKDPRMVHCPICSEPVHPSLSSDDGSGWTRLRECPECDFSFCSFCKRTWHGPLAPCPIFFMEAVVNEYLALPEDSQERRTIENKFGAANFRRMVKMVTEDRATEEYIQNTTTRCPQCKVNVEKSFGCNHMTCSKCQEHFCFRCGAHIDKANPYAHFQQKGNCFQRLFDLDGNSEEMEWQPIEGFDLE